MRPGKVPALLALLMLVSGADAAAKDPDREEVRRVSDEFGTCVVRRHREDAREFVRTVIDGTEVTRRQRARLFSGDCLVEATTGTGTVTMSFPATTFHDALAVALVQAD